MDKKRTINFWFIVLLIFFDTDMVLENGTSTTYLPAIEMSELKRGPFVEIGSEVKEGDVVCIIEAMKLMNAIKSEHAGKVTQICVKNGDPIEYGQVLMYLE